MEPAAVLVRPFQIKIGNAIQRAIRAVPSWVDDVLVVDDGSTDATATVNVAASTAPCARKEPKSRRTRSVTS